MNENEIQDMKNCEATKAEPRGIFMPLNASIRKGKERKFSNVDLFS
jgi:hypothetical protein